MPETALFLGSDGGVFVEHPRDVSDKSSPQDIVTATATFRVYDATKPVVVQVGDSDVATDTFTVFGQQLFDVGQQVSVRGNDNNVFSSTIQSVTPGSSLSTIVLDDAIGAGVKVPDRMRWWADTLGVGFPMSLYGTPSPGNDDWGYRGTIADNHPNLYHDQRVIVEVDFDGGDGLRRVTYLERVVKRADT